jgi:hypothetical protein
LSSNSRNGALFLAASSVLWVSAPIVEEELLFIL